WVALGPVCWAVAGTTRFGFTPALGVGAAHVTHAMEKETSASEQPEHRTYEVRTFGCPMNVRASERLSGLLEDSGYQPAANGEEPDVLVFNTCAVRENADNRLYGTLAMVKPMKDRNPGMQIAVGGCMAQKDKDAVVDRAPWVDVVFGT